MDGRCGTIQSLWSVLCQARARGALLAISQVHRIGVLGFLAHFSYRRSVEESLVELADVVRALDDVSRDLTWDSPVRKRQTPLSAVRCL